LISIKENLIWLRNFHMFLRHTLYVSLSENIYKKYKESNVDFSEKLLSLITSHRLVPRTCLEEWAFLVQNWIEKCVYTGWFTEITNDNNYNY